MDKELFPIPLAFESNGEEEVLASQVAAATYLEWIDISDTEEQDRVRAFDSRGKPVHLRVETLQLKRLELIVAARCPNH